MREATLVLLLRLGGFLTLGALFAAFLPTEWMAASHRWLGMGEFPAAPLTDYLTRSVSLLYAVHGCVLLMISTDVRRYAPLIILIGGVDVLVGIGLTVIDVRAGMPSWWTLAEGPWVALTGALLAWLAWPLRGQPA